MLHFLLQAAEEIEEVATEVTAAPMNEAVISQSLQITLIGMLILFASLFVLWGVMELLVRLVKDPKKEEKAEEAAPVVAAAADDELNVKAAVAAAAYAIAKK